MNCPICFEGVLRVLMFVLQEVGYVWLKYAAQRRYCSSCNFSQSFTAGNWTFNRLKVVEMLPFRFTKGVLKVTCARPFRIYRSPL